jgi:YD repeat-containing protein
MIGTGKYNSPKGFSGELQKKGDGAYELKTIDKEKLTFDNNGKFRRMEKCGGGSYEVDYDASGRLTSVVDAISGRNITLTWDETGKLTEVKDSMNQTWTLNYSEDGINYYQLPNLIILPQHLIIVKTLN